MDVWSHMKSILVLVAISVGLAVFAPTASAQAPGLFFTDITSGPNSGGETVAGLSGAYVTIFGNNLGATQGTSTVTLNGAACLRVVSWGTAWLWYQYVTVQLGPSCTTGNFVITTPAGTSNALPFAVRAGHIYFVMPGGSDSNAGTAAFPFSTPNKCTDKVEVAGDICYVKNVNATGLYNYGAVDLTNSGTTTSPIAVVAYPGTIGNSQFGSDSVNKGVCFCFGDNWVVSGFHLRSNTIAGYVKGNNNRIVANFIECPAVTFGTSEGCLEPFGGTVNIVAYGNESTNVGNGGKQYHAFYFGADGHDYDVGWNYIHDIQGCRGFQTYNGSVDTYNVSIHDNRIANIPCDGINLASVNPNLGFVKVYNNVVYHAGAGPDLGGQNATCLNVASTAGAFTTPVEVYNNTFYDCGALGSSDSGILSPQLPTHFRNNIIVAVGGEPYITSGTGTPSMTGTNNLYFGAGNGPSQTTANVNADPLFVSTPGKDFHPQVASPVVNAGVMISTLFLDIAGISRPQGAGYDIGAYEYFTGGSTVQRPSPPTNLAIVVQ
jgi:hypothetical protein